MELVLANTLEQYDHLYALNEGREDYFRYQMMKPFEKMWSTIQVPLKAKQPGGYDVVMAAGMLGYLPLSETAMGRTAVKMLRERHAMETAQDTLRHCLAYAEKNNLNCRAGRLVFGLYVADPVKLELQHGYTGFGGIPGFIQIMLYPNAYNLPRLPAVVAHEFHHNIRFSYFNWDHGNVTVGDYLVIEGLAESFAQELYGETLLGPWVTSINQEDLAYSLEVMKNALPIKGFAEVSSYMFGDTFAREQGYQPVGLSPFAGYSVGYHVVQSFLKRNKIGIQEATLLSAEEIISECGLFG
ncbi:hypothetical protein DNH61_02940 [Paenibacillus sambharensis]|uniref:DUF2268 domain-containing protein n=1 Tax=Paenibacillus sambharensis TaxID=1803190 RepID=A0A2W1LER5_9BACL|nr:DUF2268 domain-containing protein [Paenibacillus sambharensis]PZD97323.1 hypothetical protein DNH61_02940 [Paenibacillus sambharensis]